MSDNWQKRHRIMVGPYRFLWLKNGGIIRIIRPNKSTIWTLPCGWGKSKEQAFTFFQANPCWVPSKPLNGFRFPRLHRAPVGGPRDGIRPGREGSVQDGIRTVGFRFLRRRA